ncbi:MAG: hypothetical protein J6R85_02625, partial [Lentisphaeria bacterium]|nr:hypothetical protein [Lentisphaeria bacterium]
MANTFDPTNGNYTISTLDDFKAFRDAVNGGNKFAGKTIILATDIDLNNEEWTPIGTDAKPFSGTFDGGNHTISNLKITGYNSNVGLFGFTTDGEIKNFTLTNADVSGRLNVGAVCGTPYTSKYTNITLNGDVQVKGMAYVGGMLGKNAYADCTDLTIDAAEGSLVSAVSEEDGKAYRTYVGGVIGFMGEGGHTLKNITSNINVEGTTCDVGGIVGIAHYGNKLENVTCTADKIVLTNADPNGEQEIGGIAGVWHNENGTTVTMTNCSVSDTLQLEVQVGGVKDDALTAAVQDNTLTGAPYSATGTGTLAIPLNSDYITTDVVVKGNQTLTADTANLAAVFELTGLKAGAAREIKLYFFEAGSTEGGIEVVVQVAEGVTSMPVYLTQFANGLYDVQVKDLSNLSRPVTEFDGVQLTNGTITVEKGGLDIDNLNIGANSFVKVTGEGKLNIGSVSGKNIQAADGATLSGSCGGSIDMLGDMAIDGGLTLKGGLWASAGGTLSGDTLTATYAMFQKAAYTITADLELVYGYLSFGGTFDVYSTIHTTGTNGEVLYINGDVNLKAGGKLKSDNSIFVSYDGASLIVEEGASIEANGFSVTKATATLTIAGTATAKDVVSNAGTITIVAATGELNAKSINGNVIIDAAGFTGTDKVLNLNASSMDGKVTIINKDDDVKVFYRADGDIILSDATMDKIYVSADWAGKEFGDDLGAGMAFGINSFETLAEAKAVLGAVGGTIELVTEAGSDKVVSGSVSFANGINTITGEAAIDWSKGWF